MTKANSVCDESDFDYTDDWTWVGGLKFCWKDYSDDMLKLGGGSFKFFEIGDCVI